MISKHKLQVKNLATYWKVRVILKGKNHRIFMEGTKSKYVHATQALKDSEKTKNHDITFFLDFYTLNLPGICYLK